MLGTLGYRHTQNGRLVYPASFQSDSECFKMVWARVGGGRKWNSKLPTPFSAEIGKAQSHFFFTCIYTSYLVFRLFYDVVSLATQRVWSDMKRSCHRHVEHLARSYFCRINSKSPLQICM